MISMLELGWIAGLLEGEGCFQHRRNGDLLIQVVNGFRWTSTHQANTAGLMMTLLPLMGARRGDKIRECLGRWRGKPS